MEWKDTFIVDLSEKILRFVWRVLELAGGSFMGWLRWQSDSLVMIPYDIFAHMTQLSTSTYGTDSMYTETRCYSTLPQIQCTSKLKKF